MSLLLALTILGVCGLNFSADIAIDNVLLGALGALMCAFGWGTEAVILAKSMKDPSVKQEYALQIRQSTSALVYGAVILPILKGWGFTVHLFTDGTGWLLYLIVKTVIKLGKQIIVHF